MKGWKECKLGEVASIQTGPFGSQLHASDYVQVGIPAIMPTNIGRRLEIIRDKIECITDKDASRLSKYLVKEGDIVYSRRGDVEKCAYISLKEENWLCGTGCLRIRFNIKNVDPKFGAYFLSTDEIKGWVSGNAVGTTMPNLNSTILSNLPLILPPLPEQRAIAGVLSSLDDKIDLLHRQNKTLEAMAEALFRQWFVEPCRVNLPTGWYSTKIKDFKITVTDFVANGSFASLKENVTLITEKEDFALFIRNTDLKSDFSQKTFVDSNAYEFLSHYCPKQHAC